MNYTALYTPSGTRVKLRVAIKLWRLGFTDTYSVGANWTYRCRILG
jgi:hypothetical protein